MTDKYVIENFYYKDENDCLALSCVVYKKYVFFKLFEIWKRVGVFDNRNDADNFVKEQEEEK